MQGGWWGEGGGQGSVIRKTFNLKKTQKKGNEISKIFSKVLILVIKTTLASSLNIK